MRINIEYDSKELPCLSAVTYEKKGKVDYGKATTFYGENAVFLFEILVNRGLPESLSKKIYNFCALHNLDFSWNLENFQSIRFIFNFRDRENKFEFCMDLKSIIFYEEESYGKIVHTLCAHYYILNHYKLPEELLKKVHDFCEEYGLWFSCRLKNLDYITFEFVDNKNNKVHFDIEIYTISTYPDDAFNQIKYNLNVLYSLKGKKAPDNFCCIKNPVDGAHDTYTIEPYSKRFFAEIKRYLSHKINKYGFATVNNLHAFLGIPYDKMDDKFGWTNLSEIKCIKKEGKMLLIMPKAMSIKGPDLIEIPFADIGKELIKGWTKGLSIAAASATVKDIEKIISNKCKEFGYGQGLIDILQYTLNAAIILSKDENRRTQNEIRYLFDLPPVENDETK